MFAVLWFSKSSAMGCWGGREGMAPCGAWEAQSSSCGGAERWGGRVQLDSRSLKGGKDLAVRVGGFMYVTS